MLKTFYTDGTRIRQLLDDFPGDDRALHAGAVLDDLGVTLTDSLREFEQLAASDVFLGGGEVGVEFERKFYLVVHRRSSILPETPDDPCPQFNPAHRRMRGEWWRRSKVFHRHAGRYGWPEYYCINGPLERFLKQKFGTHCPFYLSDAQYAEAWKLTAWGPPPAD